MKNYSPAFAAHILLPVTTLAICWRVRKNDGTLILGTNHDRSIPIAATNIGVDLGSPAFDLTGVYEAGSGIVASSLKTGTDMSVDNMEVEGALERQAPDLFLDVSVADIRSGLLDGAQVTTFRVNWQDPDDFQDVLRHGFFGQVDWNTDGSYRVELRGLTQVLQQSLGRTAGEVCDVEEFGDARCKKDLGPLTATGIVTAVTNRRRFDAALTPGPGAPAPPLGYFNLGRVRWLTGDNVGFPGQVKSDSEDSTLGHLLLHEELPEDVQVGDTFELPPGCNRRYETCKDVHENIINFRGPGIFTPGPDAIIRAPQ